MLAVAGGKGGSGKTTTTLGLAGALARSNRSPGVTAVDADWDLPNLARLAAASGISSNATATTCDGTNTTREPERTTVVDAVREPERVGFHDTSTPTVLAAPRSPGDHDARTVLEGVSQASPDGARVLVDCPAGAGPDAAAPLRVADATLLVTSLRVQALRDTAKTAAMARALDAPPVGVVAVRASTAPAALGDLFDCPELGSIPAAPPDPLAAAAVRSAYDAIAERLLAREEGQSPADGR